MAVEERERVTRIGIVRVNGKPEELDGPDGRRQPPLGGTSRVSREAQARICERLGVKFPGATRLTPVWAFVWNLRSWLAMFKGKGTSGRTARPKVPMRGPGADCSIVARKRGNSRGVKGAGDLRGDQSGSTGNRRNPLVSTEGGSLQGSYEPDKSRGLRPVL